MTATCVPLRSCPGLISHRYNHGGVWPTSVGVQIEGHLAATNRMAPAMLQIPGSARYLPMTAVVVFTGTRFLTAFQPDVGASPPGSDDPRATKKIRADAEPATPECSNGVDWNGTVMLKQSKVPLGQANKQVAVVDGTTPAADLATAGADLLAAVIAGDAPATISASQFLALIAAAQYFLAEDLLNPLGEYAEPVLDNLTTPLVCSTPCRPVFMCFDGRTSCDA